ncbi:MAG: O-antigen ligase family protein [Kiloniellales bacterium]|nr:O-antigen ligase family protein [Kiloniellales bacterium]
MRALAQRLGGGPLIQLEWLFALLMATAFAYFVGTGFWVGAAGILGLVAFVLLILMRPDAITVIWFVGMPTIFIVGNNALSGIPFVTFDRLLFLAAFGLLVARLLVQPRSVQRIGPIEKSMALLLLVFIISWAFTMPGKSNELLWDDTAMLFDTYLMPFAAFLVARNIAWSEVTVKRFLWCFVLVVGSYLIVTGLLQYVLGMDFFMSKQHRNMHPDRMTGPFINALVFGIILASVFMMALWLFLHSKQPWQRLLLLGMIGGLCLCILLSKGRAVWLAMPIALGYLFLMDKRIRPLLIALALLAGLAAPPLTFVMAERAALGERLGARSPVFNRVALYATAVDMIKERPIFGFGFGISTYGDHRTPFLTSWGDVPAQYSMDASIPHNEFLNVLVLVGVVGLVPFVILFWYCWRALARCHSGRDPCEPHARDLALYVQAIFIIVVVNGQFMDVSRGHFFLFTMLFFLMGMVVRTPPAVIEAERLDSGFGPKRPQRLTPPPEAPASGRA